jgi:hypothetical protein
MCTAHALLMALVPTFSGKREQSSQARNVGRCDDCKTRDDTSSVLMTAARVCLQGQKPTSPTCRQEADLPRITSVFSIFPSFAADHSPDLVRQHADAPAGLLLRPNDAHLAVQLRGLGAQEQLAHFEGEHLRDDVDKRHPRRARHEGGENLG